MYDDGMNIRHTSTYHKYLRFMTIRSELDIFNTVGTLVLLVLVYTPIHICALLELILILSSYEFLK